MDTADLQPLVEDLSTHIDDLEESLAPLLKTALSHSTSKLPLLDKAKVYVLVTYAIESVLFSCLRLHGVEAKSHPVFKELARVKEYFAKIKTAETAGTKRTTTLDKDAANRFIKHGLAGNEKYDREREERITREKAGAKRKFDGIQVGTHTRFDGSAKKIKAAEDGQNGTISGGEDFNSEQDPVGASAGTTDAEVTTAADVRKRSKAEKRAAKQHRRLERRLREAESSEGVTHVGEEIADDELRGNSRNQRKDEEGEESQEASKATAEALESLLQISSADEEHKVAKKKKKKRKSKSQKLEEERAAEMK